jgi:hypothetical protein
MKLGFHTQKHENLLSEAGTSSIPLEIFWFVSLPDISKSLRALVRLATVKTVDALSFHGLPIAAGLGLEPR